MVVDARRHLGTGDLVAAARAVPALTAAPENPDVLKTREEILGAAENGANAAKTGADSSGAPESANTARPPNTFSRQPPRDVRAVPKTSSRPFASSPAQQSYAGRRFRRLMPLQLSDNATALIKQRNYPQAARVIVEALKRAPGDTDLLELFNRLSLLPEISPPERSALQHPRALPASLSM